MALTDQLQFFPLLWQQREELEAQTESRAKPAVEQEMMNDELPRANGQLAEALREA